MKYLITRTDDFGSAASADQVILKAVSEGNYVKNVSCMAVTPHIEKDAKELEVEFEIKQVGYGIGYKKFEFPNMLRTFIGVKKNRII